MSDTVTVNGVTYVRADATRLADFQRANRAEATVDELRAALAAHEDVARRVLGMLDAMKPWSVYGPDFQSDAAGVVLALARVPE